MELDSEAEELDAEGEEDEALAEALLLILLLMAEPAALVRLLKVPPLPLPPLGMRKRGLLQGELAKTSVAKNETLTSHQLFRSNWKSMVQRKGKSLFSSRSFMCPKHSCFDPLTLLSIDNDGEDQCDEKKLELHLCFRV